MAADSTGHFVVVWESFGQDGDFGGVFGQGFDDTGAALGVEFQVNTHTHDSQQSPAVAADAAGNFMVTWENDDYYARSDVVGQHFDSTGARVGGEFQVNAYTTGEQQRPAVAAGAAGNIVVVWESIPQDGSLGGVFGKCYGCPAGRLKAALPDPGRAAGQARRVAQQLAKSARAVQKRMEKGAAAPGRKRKGQYKRACGRLDDLLRIAERADAKGMLKVPFDSIATAADALQSGLGC